VGPLSQKILGPSAFLNKVQEGKGFVERRASQGLDSQQAAIAQSGAGCGVPPKKKKKARASTYRDRVNRPGTPELV